MRLQSTLVLLQVCTGNPCRMNCIPRTGCPLRILSSLAGIDRMPVKAVNNCEKRHKIRLQSLSVSVLVRGHCVDGYC